MKIEKPGKENTDDINHSGPSDLQITDGSSKHSAIRHLVIIAIILLIVFSILLPVLSHLRQVALRVGCEQNLQQIGMSMGTYINDYDGQFPRSGGVNGHRARQIPNWMAPNRYVAYGLAADGTGGVGNISSCFYLLIKFAYTPQLRAFVCKGDYGATVFSPAEEGAGDRDYRELWDFGPQPSKHCSYSYHHPFGPYYLTKSSDPGMALVADRNPFIGSPFLEAKEYGLFNPDGNSTAQKWSNAITHKEEGQNVLYVDGHVSFERRAFCGIDDDNIYTFWDGGDIRRGGLPNLYCMPGDEKDSLLVHDSY